MKKAFSIIIFFVALQAVSFAQFSGSIRGIIVDRATHSPIKSADVVLFVGNHMLSSCKTGDDGSFAFEALANDNYRINVSACDYFPVIVNVIVEKGLERNLRTVSMSPLNLIARTDESSFGEFQMDESGFSDSPLVLYNSNDVYSNVAGFGFGSIRFKNRGYNSDSQEVYLAGVRMNDALTGYSPYSLWSGLNEATRSKDSSFGLDSYDEALGLYNGVTNVFATADEVRKGTRFSVLSNSSVYRFRFMGSYASGLLDNGWSFAANFSARLGGNDWVKGVYYRNFAYYIAADKRWGDEHKLSLVSFASPGQRGAQNASTQEVYDLMGDNMYNSNWGYQNGKIRNARVRKTFEPVTFVRYSWTPDDRFTNNLVLLWRTGMNGYSALDWYNAPDPRPDYYRNLPSYFFMLDEDYDRNSEEKSEWAKEQWRPGNPDYVNYQHINWDRLYNVNYNNGGRSKYALEERHVDQNDFHLVDNAQWISSPEFKMNGGVDFRFDAVENYKKMADLLGGQYYLNVDQFAERDFGGSQARIQNDLDYWLEHGDARTIKTGDKYGYDYLSYVLDGNIWVNGSYNLDGFEAHLGLKAGFNSFWRNGLYRKGLFAGANEDGSHIIDPETGEDLTELSNGQTSKGKSAVSRFFTYSAKAGLAYNFPGGHRVSGNAGYFNEAPAFNNSFISPRTRNTLVDNLDTRKTFSSEVSYQYDHRGLRGRITGYFTSIKDQCKVMSFYDDSQNSFTNFAMTGIDERHIGIEMGLSVPLPIKGLSATAVLAWGEHIYTSNPHMVQTIDNSASVIREENLAYWKETPLFSKVIDPDSGVETYERDLDNNYVVKDVRQHYVSGTPQFASDISLNYRTDSYWFFELGAQYFKDSYLEMNPLYRTRFACSGPDGVASPYEIEYMSSQEKFPAVFLMNASIGKTWFIQRKYQFGINLNMNNLTDNRNVRTGGYEQTRLIKSAQKDIYLKFDPKYYYMPGFNYLLNVYFKF